jgi:hypothetical protein
MALSLTGETRATLSVLARSRTAPAQHVERSAIILHLADRRRAGETAAALGIDRQRVTRCARRIAAVGPLGDQRLAAFAAPAGHRGSRAGLADWRGLRQAQGTRLPPRAVDVASVGGPCTPPGPGAQCVHAVVGRRSSDEDFPVFPNGVETEADAHMSARPAEPHDPNTVKIAIGSGKIDNINRLQAVTFLRWLAKRRAAAVAERLNGDPNQPRASIFVRAPAEGTSGVEVSKPSPLRLKAGAAAAF